MTPQQQTDWTLAQAKEARRWMTREQFVSSVNMLWDALAGTEAILADPEPAPAQLTLEGTPL